MKLSEWLRDPVILGINLACLYLLGLYALLIVMLKYSP